MKEILEKAFNGEPLDIAEGLRLFESDHLHEIGLYAKKLSERLNSGRVYFVVNRHINPTNICVNRCRFCAFSRSKGETGAYELSIEDVLERVKSSPAELKELHIVGGLHPDRDLGYYEKMLSGIKQLRPHVHIKAFTAVEIDYLARKSSLTVEETLARLKKSGLDAMPGGGAEIFNEEVRARLCPEKISGKRWLEVHRTAHKLGIRTNATMLYGHIESYKDRVEHLLALRELQAETGGFQAFVPLPYHPENTYISTRFPSGIDDLKTIAISRLILNNIPHIKAYWIMLGEKLTQIALCFGADDIDGTVIEEKITHSAGAQTEEGLTRERLVELIKRAGRVPVERDALYNVVRIYT